MPRRLVAGSVLCLKATFFRVKMVDVFGVHPSEKVVLYVQCTGWAVFETIQYQRWL